MSDKLRVVFAGTPDFSVPTLNALAESDAVELVGVYSQPDRPSGRGRKLTAGPVKQRALELELPVFQPLSLRDEAAQAELASLNADLIVVVAYGLILPKVVLDMPTHGCVNVHASLLPRWRGAAPIQRAIEAGDTLTGVTIMQMDVGLDTGDMLLTLETAIEQDMTGGELHDVLAQQGYDGIQQYLTALLKDDLKPTVQNDEAANYAHKMAKEESVIDWSQDAATIYNRCRAFIPWPVCQTTFNEDTLRVWQARLSNTNEYPHGDETAGTVISANKKGIVVRCGDGRALTLLSVQLPGKKAMDAAAFCNGRDALGVVLGQPITSDAN